MRPAISGSDAAERRGITLGVWALIPLIVVVTYFFQIFETFDSVGCEGVCDLDLSFGARAFYPWEVGVALMAALVTAGVLRLRGKPTYGGPLLGVVLVLISAIVTSILFQTGLAPMRERNDRIARGEAPAEMPAPLPDPVGRWEASVDSATYLQFTSDGTVTGSDGCNGLSGRWDQDDDGRIIWEMASTSTTICDGIDTWLSEGRSGDIIDDYLYVNGETGSAIGGLRPAD